MRECEGVVERSGVEESGGERERRGRRRRSWDVSKNNRQGWPERGAGDNAARVVSLGLGTARAAGHRSTGLPVPGQAQRRPPHGTALRGYPAVHVTGTSPA